MQARSVCAQPLTVPALQQRVRLTTRVAGCRRRSAHRGGAVALFTGVRQACCLVQDRC